MIQKLLDRAKELCAGATDGPWIEREDLDYYQCGTYLGVGPYRYLDGKMVDGLSEDGKADYFKCNVCRIESGDGDKSFIAASRELVPLLVAIVERQQRALDKISKESKAWSGTGQAERFGRFADNAIHSCDALAAEWGNK